MMGMALNQSSPPKLKSTKDSFHFAEKKSDNSASNNTTTISEVPEKKMTELDPEDLDDDKFKQVDDFTKMFQKINSFKESRANMTDEQRKDQAAKIMLDLMKGFGEDLSKEDLEKM
jgi:hypothetical protein